MVDVEDRMEGLEIWGVAGGKLATRIEFDSYRKAAFFANAVFSVSERMNHHPEVTVEYGAVEIDIETHGSDELTEKDFELAEQLEKVLGDFEW